MTAEVTEGQLQGGEPTRQGKGDWKPEMRQDGQPELRVPRSGMPGRVVTCARRNLKTNIMASWRKGQNRDERQRDRSSDIYTAISSEVISWSLQHGSSSPAGLMSVVARHGNKHFFFLDTTYIQLVPIVH